MEHLLQVNDQRSEQIDGINSGINNARNLGSWDPDNIWWYNLKSRGTQYPVKTGDKLLDHVCYTYPVNTDQYPFRDTKYYSRWSVKRRDLPLSIYCIANCVMNVYLITQQWDLTATIHATGAMRPGKHGECYLKCTGLCRLPMREAQENQYISEVHSPWKIGADVESRRKIRLFRMEWL